MRDRENYSTARTLATVKHLDITFRIVRRRVNGKPWRKYLTLAYGQTGMCDSPPDTTDATEAAAHYAAQLERCYPVARSDSLKSMLACIAKLEDAAP